ncbi:MAG: monovalent cation/H(+) antiporter subunit G [Thioalkalivibrionaceae bacterium]
MAEFVIALLVVTGAGFMLIAALGLVRMPDLATRMHATTKAGVLGAGLILAGVAVFFSSGPVIAKVIAVIVFLILTAPVAAHVIGRAAYFVGVPLWEHTRCDELAGRYNEETHTLASPPDIENPQSHPPVESATESASAQHKP